MYTVISCSAQLFLGTMVLIVLCVANSFEYFSGSLHVCLTFHWFSDVSIVLCDHQFLWKYYVLSIPIQTTRKEGHIATVPHYKRTSFFHHAIFQPSISSTKQSSKDVPIKNLFMDTKMMLVFIFATIAVAAASPPWTRFLSTNTAAYQLRDDITGR